jgi:hypothetical protein
MQRALPGAELISKQEKLLGGESNRYYEDVVQCKLMLLNILECLREKSHAW